MIIKKTKVRSIAAKPEFGISLHHIAKQMAHSREMVLKVSLQKSTNKFLFAEATDEFIEVLVSFLVVPIGAVEFLLGGDTGFIGLDNLYRSVSNDIDGNCFTIPITKSRLIQTYPTIIFPMTIFYRSVKNLLLIWVSIQMILIQ